MISIDLLNALNHENEFTEWKADNETSEFFMITQALNYNKDLEKEIGKYLERNYQSLIKEILNGELIKCSRHNIPRLAKQRIVSEELIEKVLARYKDGRCTIKDIEEALDDIVKEFRYVKYSIQDFKIDITLGLDEYSLYTMSGYSKHKRHVVYKDAVDSLLIKTLSKYSFLCNQDVISVRDNADLFLQYADIEASSLKLEPDVEEEVTVNAVGEFVNILNENGKVRKLLKEQAEIKMALYKDITGYIDENYIKCENDEDSRLVPLSREYLNKIKEDKDFELFHVEAKS